MIAGRCPCFASPSSDAQRRPSITAIAAARRRSTSEGTPLLPKSRGEAKVESKQGYIEIEVEFDELEPATKFGPEYLTYVMWAITPEGRATNLGEVLLNGRREQAERHDRAAGVRLDRHGGAVFRGVAAERRGRDGKRDARRTRAATIEQVEAQVRAAEARHVPDEHRRRDRLTVDATMDRKAPLELYEARNAVQLSRDRRRRSLRRRNVHKASQLLRQAEEAHENGRGSPHDRDGGARGRADG